AITQDQANVNFKAMLLFAVMDQQESTILNVAFKFIDNKNLMQALIRTIEGAIRSYVANLKQAEILGLRGEIVVHVKEQLDPTLAGWGYHLIDMQLNDIAFDDAIMKSMAKVVAANNLKQAAENEGQALLITKTKAAEAEGNAIRITAEAERLAAQLRGQGVALFRAEVAKGIMAAAKEMQSINADMSVIMFSMWTEAIKNFAEAGKGNVIFLDGSSDGMQRTMQQLMSFSNKSSMFSILPDDAGDIKK
ncbi:MAG TPA: SPFH domain-containing protein, partial [Bacteroidia bacterium]|nr:SPFH domain-containing protein [Bacteroidia bacterium]